MAPAPADGSVAVVYARPERQCVVSVPWRQGLTAGEAVSASGLPREFPEIDPDATTLGIFGRRIEPSHPVVPGDRVEIYRPLPLDPKERRRRRVAEARGGPRGR